MVTVAGARRAKNHLVVMPDAEIDKSAGAIMASAFGAAGERCLQEACLVAVGDVAQRSSTFCSRRRWRLSAMV